MGDLSFLTPGHDDATDDSADATGLGGNFTGVLLFKETSITSVCVLTLYELSADVNCSCVTCPNVRIGGIFIKLDS